MTVCRGLSVVILDTRGARIIGKEMPWQKLDLGGTNSDRLHARDLASSRLRWRQHTAEGDFAKGQWEAGFVKG